MLNVKRYTRRMFTGMAAYTAGIVVLNYGFTASDRLSYLLLLLPIVPMLYTLSVIIGAVSEMDELQQKIQIEAMAFSGLATGFSSFSYLFLQDAGAPSFQPEWAFYMMWLFYGTGILLATRRYQHP